MSVPKNINSRSLSLSISERQRSIAKLSRSPLSASPVPSPGGRFDSRGNSFSNGPFLRPFSQMPQGSHSPTAIVDDDDGYLNSEGENGHPGISAGVLEGQSTNVLDQDFASGINDPLILQEAQKYLPNTPDHNLQNYMKLEGADITRELYKLTDPSETVTPLRRTKSTSLLASNATRGSTASSINVPGGFRRGYIQQQLINLGKFQTEEPSFVTRNFVEFLSIYGHFAGEDLEDEEDLIACHYKPFSLETDPERNYLLAHEQEINPNGTATETKAYFLLLKAFVGTGVLFLPKAFSNGGLLFSCLTLLFFGLISFWCYLILIYAKKATKVSGFAEIGLKLYGKWLQQLILSLIIISQIGFVAAYIVFTSENVRAFYATVTGVENATELNILWFILFQLVIFLPLLLIRDITKLSLLAVLANIFILLGLVTIVCYTCNEWLVVNSGHFGPKIEYLFQKDSFSLFIGVAIFAFEGIGLIIPIEQSMIHPQKFPQVLGLVISTISVIFIGIGALGYLTFGSEIETVIILNLPQKSVPIIAIQLLYAFAILLSTPLQLFPAIRLLELKLFVKTGKSSVKTKWAKNFFRFAFVLVTAGVAVYGGQNLDRFVSFVGCFACIPLVYMYPPILHMKSCCNYSQWGLLDEERRRRWRLLLMDYSLVVIGGVAMVYTTYQILGA